MCLKKKMKRVDFKSNSGRFIPCPNSSNCCIQCWSFPPQKNKQHHLFSDQNPGRNWKKGYDILPTSYMGMKCHKAMKFSDPGTRANHSISCECQINVGFVAIARCFRSVVDSISEWDRTYCFPMPGSTPRILGSGAWFRNWSHSLSLAAHIYDLPSLTLTVHPRKLLEKEKSYWKPTIFWGWEKS